VSLTIAAAPTAVYMMPIRGGNGETVRILGLTHFRGEAALASPEEA
jgi:hypothetical protein